MSSFRIRPRFIQIVEIDPEAAREQIVRRIESETSRCEVRSFPGYVTLLIPEKDQHFWSPQLSLSLEATAEGRTVIHGIYGPNANVWTLFLYGYLLVGSLGLFAGIFGCAQWIVGQTAWGLIVLGALVTIAIGLYFLAQFGQKLGARQTYLLHLTYEAAIGKAVEIG